MASVAAPHRVKERGQFDATSPSFLPPMRPGSFLPCARGFIEVPTKKSSPGARGAAEPPPVAAEAVPCSTAWPLSFPLKQSFLRVQHEVQRWQGEVRLW